MKASMGCLSYLTEVKEAPCIDFVSKVENQIFTWSQETRVVVKWKTQVQMT